jgi:hypothetical protein
MARRFNPGQFKSKRRQIPDRPVRFVLPTRTFARRKRVENTHLSTKTFAEDARSRAFFSEQSILLIITIVLMNFYLDLARVILTSYSLYSPSTEQPIMKRQLLLSLTLSILAANAFALPAAEQAIPQVKDSHSVFSQTVAEGGSDRLIERNKVASDGYDRTPQGQTIAEGGSDRLIDRNKVASDGYDRTPQGQTVAEGGRDRLEEKGLVQDGYDRTPQGQAVAEGGGDRVIERNSAVS